MGHQEFWADMCPNQPPPPRSYAPVAVKTKTKTASYITCEGLVNKGPAVLS